MDFCSHSNVNLWSLNLISPGSHQLSAIAPTSGYDSLTQASSSMEYFLSSLFGLFLSQWLSELSLWPELRD